MSVHRPVRALLFIAAACLAVACQPADEGRDIDAVRSPGDAAREFAVGIDRQQPQLSAREWERTIGDSTATLVGYAAGDTLRLVREVVARGARGRTASRYYFDGASLRYFESEGDVVESAAADSAAGRRERLVLAFDDRGATVEASHRVDGATAPLDSVRIQQVLSRAAELARQWATIPPSPH